MKKGLFIILLSTLFSVSIAQLNIKTILPENPIIVNEPFRIQFVVEDADNKQQFIEPAFNRLKLIHGPEVYEGKQVVNNKGIQLINYVYTVVADRIGVYKIDPPAIRLNGIVHTGSIITITVEKQKAGPKHGKDDYSGQLLLPGEDPYRKIKENLFVKLIVNKQSCLVGEPIVATFKLFSRLQSRSDIVKNRAFMVLVYMI
jgi:hypothetical protein